MTTLFVTLVASVFALVSFARIAARRARQAEWLAPALSALGRATDSAALAAELAYRLEGGLGVMRVDWWRRDDDGTYRTQRDERIAGRDAAALDVMIATGGTWRRDAVSRAMAGPDASRAFAARGAELVLPLVAHARPVGALVLGPRRNDRPYDARAVTELAALADHLVLLDERGRTAALLDESQRMLQLATRLSTVGTLAAELAHEIRNPLVAVQTFLQILPERLDDPEVTGDLRAVALTELQRVARLLNELLGMARASVATFATTDLEAVVEQVVRLLQVSARKKDVNLERVGDPLPTGSADASRLKQALVNLVLNAIQASPAGTRVVVATRAIEDDARRTIVEVAVQDEGPGIPDDERERIFHPFFTTKESGTGLGLPVTRQIVTDHGGSITVESLPAHGTTFTVRLPLTAAPVERDARAA